ncbi:MAG: CvpA family protein [Planctomycetia bacterium]|nr:CvpA family protein [Planctomycetia bacterium]
MDNINPFDTLALVIIVATTFWGGMRGVITQLSSIFTWIIAWYVASHHYGVVASFLSSSTAKTPIATSITFILTVILLSIVTRVIKNGVSLVGLKEFDRQMGALLGMVKGVLFCMILVFFAVILSPQAKELITGSTSGGYFITLIGKVENYLPDNDLTRRFNDVVGYVEEQKEQEEVKSARVQFDDLKQYLKERVLSNQAAEIIEQTESDADTNDAEQGLNFTRLLSGLDQLGESLKAVFQPDQTASQTNDVTAGRTSAQNYANVPPTSVNANANNINQEYGSNPFNTVTSALSSFYSPSDSNPENNDVSSDAPANSNGSSVAETVTNGISDITNYLSAIGNAWGNAANVDANANYNSGSYVNSGSYGSYGDYNYNDQNNNGTSSNYDSYNSRRTNSDSSQSNVRLRSRRYSNPSSQNYY